MTPKRYSGPIADALTHRTMAMLRRLAGAPVRGENYFKAEIVRAGWGRSSPESEWSLIDLCRESDIDQTTEERRDCYEISSHDIRHKSC